MRAEVPKLEAKEGISQVRSKAEKGKGGKGSKDKGSGKGSKGGRGATRDVTMVEGYAIKESSNSAFSEKGGKGSRMQRRADKPCFNWQTTGNCRFGDSCIFRHEEDTEKKPESVRKISEDERAELDQYRRLFASQQGENKMTAAVRCAIQKTGAATETATVTETVRKLSSKKAEAFRKAARERIKTKRYPKQVKKTPARAPSYQEEQKTELKKLKLAAGDHKIKH